jgi:ribosomal protein L18E
MEGVQLFVLRKNDDLLKLTRDYLQSIKKESIPTQENIVEQLEKTKQLNAKEVLSRIEKIRNENLFSNNIEIQPKIY